MAIMNREAGESMLSVKYSSFRRKKDVGETMPAFKRAMYRNWIYETLYYTPYQVSWNFMYHESRRLCHSIG